MIKQIPIIILLTISFSLSLFGQGHSNKLPDVFYGNWVESPSQCDISPLLSISIEDGKLVVNGYEWFSDEVKVIKNDEYYSLQIKGFSEGEEFNSEINIKMSEDGNLIIIDLESEETILIRCDD